MFSRVWHWQYVIPKFPLVACFLALKKAKYPQLVAQHCFVASFGRCFPFFTLRDQRAAQQKHLLRVEESFCEK